jgi:glycogen synthase
MPTPNRPPVRSAPMIARRASVLLVSWEYPPLVEGGLARHVGKLSVGLAAAGLDVHVLTRGSRAAAAEEEIDGVRIHRTRVPAWPADPGCFAAWVGRMNGRLLQAGTALAERYDFDLVHGHDWLVAAAADGLATTLGRPLVMTIHATEYGRHQGWIVGQPQSAIHDAERAIVHRADGLIACSRFMAGHIADVFGVDESAIRVIPNGVDPADLVAVDPAALARLRGRFADADQPLVLMVGRLVYEKGFQVGLGAVRQLLALRPRLRFVVAGTGVHEAELRAHASRLGLDAHGSFAGWVGDDLLGSLYRVADVCVIPSIYEPAGLVALEAMACGCPCVVADTGGLREAVCHGRTGLRFAVRDAGSLASMVDLLLGDWGLRDALVRVGREHVAGFAWASAAAATAGVYSGLLDTSWPVSHREREAAHRG